MSMTCESEWFGREKNLKIWTEAKNGSGQGKTKKSRQFETLQRERERDFGENDDKYKKYIA